MAKKKKIQFTLSRSVKFKIIVSLGSLAQAVAEYLLN